MEEICQVLLKSNMIFMSILEVNQFNGYLFKIISMTAILKSKMAILNLLILFNFFCKYHGKVFNCELEIHVLNPKVAQNHLRINSV